METHFPNLDENYHSVRKRLMADLGVVAMDAEALLQATADNVTAEARVARTHLAAALEKAKTTYAEFEAHSIAVAKKTDAAIRANPYKSTGIAVGVGVVLGILLARK
ncbi:hypothetical protein CMV30_13405 [Nibricoccus aquaticus]|uniref:DUF883 domain-containing protein n=1 Tax=Nibricoccus aquaticus TaxID=2576891 RepID=A0A290Q8W4_9BACT|nr:DUF883 family protein [Nibricoccus aquaticus]ATC64883.1 hypothetical protein CMV30_13405 [Nibricoccus aquaticus]